MPRTLVVAAAVALGVLVLSLALLTRARGPARAPAERASESELAPERQLPADALLPALEPARTPRAPERVAEVPAPAAASAAPAPAAPARVRARVIDADGRPRTGVRVRWPGGSAESDARGELEVPAQLRPSALRVETEALALVAAGRASEGGAELVLVVAPAVALEGRTVDEESAPIGGVEVVLLVSTLDLPGLSFRLPAEEGRRFVTRSDGGGRFRLSQVPRVGGRWRVEAPGYELGASAWSADDLAPVLRLRPTDARARFRVDGWVLRADGSPAGGARVCLGPSDTRAEDDGRFELVVDPAYGLSPSAKGWREEGERHALAAFLDGAPPAAIPGFGARLDDPQACTGVVLRLGERALSIAGRVLGADGKPRAGARLVLLDPTTLGLSSATVEMPSSAERELFSAADGGFRIGGLLERSYRVLALDEQRGLAVESGAVPAGRDDLELRFPPDALREVEGRVRARDGEPLAAVELRATRAFGEPLVGHVWSSVAVRSDAEGRFALGALPCAALTLLAQGDDLERRELELEPGERDLELTVELARVLHLRVEALDPAEADGFAWLDEAGERVTFRMTLPGGGTGYFTQARLRDGRSGTCAVPEHVHELLLLRGSEPLRRVPLALDPRKGGALQSVRF